MLLSKTDFKFNFMQNKFAMLAEVSLAARFW